MVKIHFSDLYSPLTVVGGGGLGVGTDTAPAFRGWRRSGKIAGLFGR